MKRAAIALALLAFPLVAGCLSKVPPAERARDTSWRQTSEQLSRPTTLN